MILSAQELLQRNGIAYKATTKNNYTTKCPTCGEGYCNVKIERDSVAWYCHHCLKGGREPYEQRGADDRYIVELGPIKATYDYTDENGKRLFQTLRFEPIGKPKVFRQRTGPDQKKWSIKGVRIVPYRLPELIDAVANDRVVFVVEGEKDVETLRAYGIDATTNPMGAEKWPNEFAQCFRDADIVICGDNDQPGRNHVLKVARNLKPVARCVRVLDLKAIWSDIEESDDITDWFKRASGASAEALVNLIGELPPLQEPPREDAPKSKANGQDPQPLGPPLSINEVLEVFERWLILSSATPVNAVLGTVAANMLPGDPVWLGVIGPPSSAKTEILNSISLLPKVAQAATVTLPGLLSGTPKKQRDKYACGGLLRQLGDFGIIALKDFGSVLSMRPDAKAEVLGALREIFDGAWTRVLGTDGGKTLSWRGKIGLVFCATGVIDSHYTVIGEMGDRFLFSRLKPVDDGQFEQALLHTGAATKQMRKELAEAVARLFAGRRAEPRPITAAEIQRLDNVIRLVVRLRGAIQRDRYSREMENVLGAEGTARIGLYLERLLAGLDTLGVDRETALEVVISVALDSTPPLRRRAYELLNSPAAVAAAIANAAVSKPDDEEEEEEDEDDDNGDNGIKTSVIAKALGLPTNTVRRALEDLTAYGLLRRTRAKGNADLWVVVKDLEAAQAAAEAKPPSTPQAAQAAAEAKPSSTPQPFAAEKVGPAPVGIDCVHCHGRGTPGPIFKIRDARRPGSKPDILHEGCAERWFCG
jgi:hypothetical protein